MDIRLCAPADVRALACFSGEMSEDIPAGLGSTVTTPLITGFLNCGHEVTLYTLSRGLDEERHYRWGNLRVFVGPYRSRNLARNFFAPEISYLKRAIDNDHAHFVHAHWTYEFALAPLRLGVKTLVTIHDLPWKVMRHFGDMYRAVRLAMAYEVALRGRYFTAVSEDAANHFRRNLCPWGKIAVIPNGLPEWVFEEGLKTRTKAYGEVVFATVLQGWTQQKNPKVVLEAFARVREALPTARLTMFGTGYEECGPARQWAADRNLDAGVCFIGALPHQELLRRVVEEVDIVVHPALDESFSMATVEAMALRKPVIGGANTTGVREVLGGGSCGLLTDVRSYDVLADAMVRLARNEAERSRLSATGYERAFERYRIAQVIKRYEEQYAVMQQVKLTSAAPGTVVN